MGVYINMEIPQSFINVRIYSDGRVISQSISKFGEQIATAISIPPHGRLIDKDVMCNECRRIAEEYGKNGGFTNSRWRPNRC